MALGKVIAVDPCCKYQIAINWGVDSIITCLATLKTCEVAYINCDPAARSSW